ncbi:hypothetical protein K525DRAFT_288874 [Schizophyllum commune Loenen D]|nr:hypothetical protein K525DRAFT_288874 [Schizophyllum commune Loenen D]
MPGAIDSALDVGGTPLELSSNAARDALLSIGELGEIVDAPECETMNIATPSSADAIPTASSSKPGSSNYSLQKQLDHLHAAICDLRTDNATLRSELAQLKLDHASIVSALCSEIARVQAMTLSSKACPPAPSGLLHTSSGSRFRPSALPFTASTLAAPSTALPPTSSGLPIRSSASSFPAIVALSSTLRRTPNQASTKFLRAQATLLAAERAEALLSGLSEEARQVVPTESRREVRTSDQAKARLSALFSASESASKLSEPTEHTRPLALSRNEAVDALAASHAILELQQLCDFHGNSNYDSFDSLLSEDCGSDFADSHGLDPHDLQNSTPNSPDSLSVYSTRGSSPEKLNVSPFATLTATPFSQSAVSLRTEQASPAELPDAPSGVHPASLAPSPMMMPPHQRLLSSNSKSRIPIPLGWRRLNSSSPSSPPLSLTTFTPRSPSSTGAAEGGETESMLAPGFVPGKGSRMSEDQRGSPRYGSVASSGVPKPF